MKEIAEFIAGFFNSIKLPFRWLAVILLIAAVVIGLAVYEHITGHFYLTRLEREVGLLKEMLDIADQNLDLHPELLPIYKSLVSNLTRQVAPQSQASILLNHEQAVTWGKAISGASVWIMLLFIGVLSDIRKTRKLSLTTGVIAFVVFLLAVLFGWLGTLIPTIFNPWVNYVGFPLTQAVIFSLLVLLVIRRKTVAEIERLRAEADRIRAETDRIRSQMRNDIGAK